MPLRRRLFLGGLAAATGTKMGEGVPVPTISLAEMGAQPDAPDAAPYFHSALARLPRTGGATLHVPPGTWRFAATTGIAIHLQDFKALTIEGPGALLLFNGLVKPFVFDRCQNPTVRGLRIDWERPPFSQGDVIRVAPNGRAAEIQIDPAFAIDGSEPMEALGSYDRATGLMARNAVDAYELVSASALIGPQRLRLTFNRPIPLRPGTTVVLRHALYAANALSFTRCQAVALESVIVHSAPGMAVFADRCNGVMLRGCSVVPTPGSVRLMTTTADGLHCTLCEGDITMEGCTVARTGDDCVNAHGKYLPILHHTDARTITVATTDAPPSGTVDIVSARSLEPLDHDRIFGATPGPPGQTTLHLDHDIAAPVQDGDYLSLSPAPSSLRISNCSFPGNRARGVLAHRDAVIEGCMFHGQSAEAILLLPDARFMEGPAADRVTVRGCEFTDVQRAGGTGGAIRVDVGLRGPLGSTPVNGRITIERNHFAAFAGPAVVARSVDQLTFVANRTQGIIGPILRLDGVAHSTVMDNTPREVLITQTTPAAAMSSPPNRSSTAR